MDIIEFREYCLAKAGVTEGFPFDDKTIVFKVAGKMFALAGIENFDGINLKCDPERAIVLREDYSEINPGYHMNKKHWNTVSTIGQLSNKLLSELIDHSYELVVASLPKKVRENLNN